MDEGPGSESGTRVNKGFYERTRGRSTSFEPDYTGVSNVGCKRGRSVTCTGLLEDRETRRIESTGTSKGDGPCCRV